MGILIIGTGAVAAVISKYLARDKDASLVLCASRDIKRARDFIDIREPKIELVKLDAADTRRIAAVAKKKGINLIINASLPIFNETIMAAALRAGCHYQDLASQLADLIHAEQFKYDGQFRKAGLLGLINTGAAPGITNLLAREGADQLEQVDEINFRLVEEQKANEFVFAWSPEVTLDTLTCRPLIYKKGRFVFSRLFGDAEEYDFPCPFGKRRVFHVYGDEVATVPLFIKAGSVDFKSCGTDIELAKILYGLGLLNKEPVMFKGRKIIPLEFFSKIAPKAPTRLQMLRFIEEGIIENAVLALVVEVKGKRDGQKIKIKYCVSLPDLKEITRKFPGATYISYPTGLAAFAFAKIIPQITLRGVIPPEALSSGAVRKLFLTELTAKGIVISEEISKY